MSAEAQGALLGALLQDFRLWSRVAGIVQTDDFDVLHGREVAQVIAGRTDLGGDFTMLSSVVSSAVYAAAMGWAADAGFAPLVEQYAQTIAEEAKRIQVMVICQEVLRAKVEGSSADELAEKLHVGLDRVASRRQSTSMTFNQVIDAADQHVIAMKSKREPGVPTGIPCLDQRTGGLPNSRVIVIAGRPSTGKSALANQIAVHAASKGYPGLICSLEMSEIEVGLRAMAHRAQVNVSRLGHGGEQEHREVLERASELCSLQIFVDTDTYGLDAICAQIAAHKRLHGITWAIVDHIGLVEVGGYSNRNDQLGVISRRLKKLAKKLNIPIVAISQLSRGVEKDRRRPVLSDLRDSGNVEQDADICLFLHSESDDTVADPVIQLGLLKNRAGRRGWIGTKVVFDGATQTFREIAEFQSPPVPRAEPRTSWASV